MEPAPRTPLKPSAPAPEEEEELEEPEEGDTAGQFKYQFDRATQGVRRQFTDPDSPLRRHAFKALLALGILLLAYWYFFLRPQPGTLSVQAALIDDDSKKLAGAAVSLAFADGSPAHEDTITDETGRAVLAGVPSQSDLVLTVRPSDGKLEPFTARVRISSGESKALAAAIGVRTGLRFVADHYDLSLPANCQQTLQVPVANAGQQPETASLVADDDTGFLKPLPDVESLSTGETAVFSVAVSAKQAAAGKLRIKDTTRSAKVSVQVSDQAPNMEAAFAKTQAQDFTASAAELPVRQASQVTISNTAPEGAPPLTDLNVSVRGDVADWVTLSDLDFIDAANQKGGLEPGKDVIFTYKITVPAGTQPGPYTGILHVSSACDEKNLPLNLVVG